MEKFNPKGKTFHFRLSAHSCYECRYGVCSLQDLTIRYINEYESNNYLPEESDEKYCIGIAKLILEDELNKKLDIIKYSCGHYSLSDGQHRVCAAAHLLDNNIDIEFVATITEEPSKCYYCEIYDKYNCIPKSPNLLHKILKTKCFRDYEEKIRRNKEYISTLEEKNILRKL